MLVVSADVRNRSRGDVVIIPVFSRGRLGPTRVPLLEGMGDIARDSVLFCEEITTIDRDFLADGPLGEPVPDAILERVLRAVRRALGEVVPEPENAW